MNQSVPPTEQCPRMTVTGLMPQVPGRWLMVACLATALLPAWATGASPKSGRAAALSMSRQSDEAVGRLIIRYRQGVKLAGQGSASAVTERLDAAAFVNRSAALGQAGGVRYLKSVASNLHVAALEQAVSAESAQALVQALLSDPAVESVEPDWRVHAHLVPDDPQYRESQQWHLLPPSSVAGGIHAPAAWDRSTGAGVVVAVLDGGYRPHADLAANVLAGYDFISADPADSFGGNLYWTANDSNARDADPQDPGDWVSSADEAAGYCSQSASSWHGTHVAGLVASVGNNQLGGTGVAYGARLLPVRVLGRCGGYVSDILAGARWAAGLTVPGVPANPTPARIINLSLGVARTCDSTTQSVIDEIRALNVNIVASTGNEAEDTSISMPANCAGVLAVTAHTREGDSADYANVGPGTDISAPGGGANTLSGFFPLKNPRGVLSLGNTGTTTPGSDTYVAYQGTSMAAPQVAGVLALLAAARPELTHLDLEAVVMQSARAFPAGGYCEQHSGVCGSGLLDAAAAMELAQTFVPGSAVSSDSGSGSPAADPGSGGGCTVAPAGQADAGLMLLAGTALLVLLWRRRQPC